jgi:hypothetical protein
VTKILILLAVAFLALGAFRWAAASPRPRWMAPALAGVTVAALLFRLGALGIAAGAAVAAALWFWPRNNSPVVADLSEEAARAALGVGPTATAAEIRAAYRQRISAAHPDRGGTAEAAARLNAARDLLLRKL